MSGVTTVGLTKTYGATSALAGIDLIVPPGAMYGLVGPNGSGKTTALEILAGLRRPSSGSVALGVPADRVAYCPDAAEFEPWLTARETLEASASLQGATPSPSTFADLLDRVGLSQATDRRVGGFSRGMTSRLSLAAGLIGEPRLLIADEPAAALDPAGRWEIIELLAELAGAITVLVSSHDLAEVERICDTIGVLSLGRLVYQGPLAELLAQAAPALRVVVRPPAMEIADAFEAAERVRAVHQDAPGEFRIDLADAVTAETELPRVLAECGARLLAVDRAGVSLQDIFFELTATGPNEHRTSSDP